jgi:hypothetical protein
VEPRVWSLIYAFAIAFISAVLFLAVDEFEPNRRYAFVLKFLIVGLGAVAVVRQLLP